MRAEVRENLMKQMANYMIDNNTTIRKTAKYFGWSKSTVFRYFNKCLQDVDYTLYLKVTEVINNNKEVRGINGAKATCEKYKTIFKNEIEVFLQELNKET